MIFALLLGCATRVSVGETVTADVPAPDHYEAAVREATRELRLYDGLSTALLVRASLRDATFRPVEEAMRAHLLLLEPDVRAVRLAEAQEETAGTWSFVFSVDSQWRKDLRFDFEGAEPWRLRLFADGRPCTPEAVEKLEGGPLAERLYPFHNPWSTLWSARFAADCGATGPLVLQMTGPHGTGELGWRSATVR